MGHETLLMNILGNMESGKVLVLLGQLGHTRKGKEKVIKLKRDGGITHGNANVMVSRM